MALFGGGFGRFLRPQLGGAGTLDAGLMPPPMMGNGSKVDEGKPQGIEPMPGTGGPVESRRAFFNGAFTRKGLPRTLQVIGAGMRDIGSDGNYLQQFQENEAEQLRAEAEAMAQAGQLKNQQAQQQQILSARDRYASGLTPEQRDEFAMDPSGYMERHRPPVWQPIPRDQLPAGARDGQINTQTGQRDVDWAPQGGGSVSLNLGGNTDGVVDNLARRFNLTGQLPTGISRDRALVREIYTRAAELAQADGVSPEQAAFNGANYQANAGGLRSLQRQRTLVQSFERTALSNLQLVQRLSRQVDRSQYPLINRLVMTGQRQTGDTAVAQYVNALIGARTEYAKVLSGATGAAGLTDSARQEAEEMFSTYASPDQIDALVDVARQEMHNRLQAFDDQEAYLRGQMTGVGGGSDANGGGEASPRLRWNPRTMRTERAPEQQQGRRRVFNPATGRLE